MHAKDRERGLKGNEASVFGQLIDRLDGDFRCWPAQSTLAEETGVSRQTAIKSLQAIERKGWMTMHPKKGRGNSCLYRVNVEEICDELNVNISDILWPDKGIKMSNPEQKMSKMHSKNVKNLDTKSDIKILKKNEARVPPKRPPPASPPFAPGEPHIRHAVENYGYSKDVARLLRDCFLECESDHTYHRWAQVLRDGKVDYRMKMFEERLSLSRQRKAKEVVHPAPRRAEEKDAKRQEEALGSDGNGQGAQSALKS